MKTLKNIPLSILMNLALAAIILSACSYTNGHQKNESDIETPGINIHTAVLSGNLEVVRQNIGCHIRLNGYS